MWGGWIMLDIIQPLTEEEGEPASFTERHMLPPFTETWTTAKQPFTSQSEKDNLSPRSTMQEITWRTCQSALDLLDTRSLVPIDLQAAHSCFHTGLTGIEAKSIWLGKQPFFSLCSLTLFVWLGAAGCVCARALQFAPAFAHTWSQRCQCNTCSREMGFVITGQVNLDTTDCRCCNPWCYSVAVDLLRHKHNHRPHFRGYSFP